VILLDTNVLSEFMRPEPDERVVAWLGRQTRSNLFTTAVTRCEKLYWVLILPDGQRKIRLQQEVAAIFDVNMAGRVLPYDEAAADAHAAIAAVRRTQGRPVDQSDAMIAGITRAHGATLATRNVRDFEDCGIPLVDPWH
jgi:predicted nucleic acid-binding protein